MTSITIPASAPASSTVPTGLFGQAGGDFSMFLKLLTTQMQNQDPLDPMDTSQYTQQLVQYSQVEQSIQQTSVLKDILGRLSGQDMVQASSLIGREVEFDSTVSGLSANGASWTWSVPRNATQISAEIVDAQGRTVATPALDPASGGGRFIWDGTMTDGSLASDGAYALRLSVTDLAGASLPATVRASGRVAEVLAKDGAMLLGIGGVALPASMIVRVAND